MWLSFFQLLSEAVRKLALKLERQRTVSENAGIFYFWKKPKIRAMKKNQELFSLIFDWRTDGWTDRHGCLAGLHFIPVFFRLVILLTLILFPCDCNMWIKICFSIPWFIDPCRCFHVGFPWCGSALTLRTGTWVNDELTYMEYLNDLIFCSVNTIELKLA